MPFQLVTNTGKTISLLNEDVQVKSETSDVQIKSEPQPAAPPLPQSSTPPTNHTGHGAPAGTAGAGQQVAASAPVYYGYYQQPVGRMPMQMPMNQMPMALNQVPMAMNQVQMPLNQVPMQAVPMQVPMPMQMPMNQPMQMAMPYSLPPINSLQFSQHGAAMRSLQPMAAPASHMAPAGVTPQKPQKKYTCHCLKSFTTSGHLARHMRIHTGEKNYVCPQEGCGSRFSRQDNCMQHYRTHLGGRGRSHASTNSSINVLKFGNKRRATGSPSSRESSSSPAPKSPAAGGAQPPSTTSPGNPLNAFAGVAILQTVQ